MTLEHQERRIWPKDRPGECGRGLGVWKTGKPKNPRGSGLHITRRETRFRASCEPDCHRRSLSQFPCAGYPRYPSGAWSESLTEASSGRGARPWTSDFERDSATCAASFASSCNRLTPLLWWHAQRIYTWSWSLSIPPAILAHETRRNNLLGSFYPGKGDRNVDLG